MEKIVKLKDGRYASIIREWKWSDNPQMNIYTENYKDRLYEDFVDVELDGQIKNDYYFGASPTESEFMSVCSTVCKKDVEFIDKL